MPLTEQEKVRVRHHTGYLNVAEAYTFVLGSPSSVETQFIIEGAMDRVKESALPLLRDLIRRLDLLEDQMVEASDLLDVSSLGEITIDPNLRRKRIAEYDYQCGGLCNLLGVTRNPFDKRLAENSINVRVGQ